MNQNDCNENGLAVRIRNGYFSYGFRKSSEPALDGVNVSVPIGAIYGLLGPSGCGKTTLLSTVVGLLKLKKGYVEVFGEVPKSERSIVPGPGVGYMPQDICLYGELTIQETIHFYGRLYGLEASQLAERIEFLIKILNLPMKNKFVGKLGGGEQRRVSLAVALIHKPPLLILDEPTVGVDPMLRQTIWDHLVELSEEGMTIIITTHYIEEAGQAHTIALMREAKLLTETTPDKLRAHFDGESLEKCFLRLCEDNQFLDLGANQHSIDSATNQNHLGHTKRGFTNSQNSVANSTADLERQPNGGQRPSYGSQLAAVMLKDLTRTRRNFSLIIFELFVPPILVIFLCFCIGPEMNDLILNVVNDEQPARYSQLWLDSIDPDIVILKPTSSLEEGLKVARNGKSFGVIHIKDGFSDAMLEKFRDGLDASNETIFKSYIDVNMDYTNSQIGGAVSTALNDAFLKISRQVLNDTGSNPLLAESPVKFENPIYGDEDDSYTNFIMPGILANLIFFFGMTLTALNCVEERKSGMFDRNRVSGVFGSQVMLSQMASYSIIVALQVAVSLICPLTILNVYPAGSLFLVILICYFQGILGLTIGLLVSVIVNDESLALLLVISFYYPTCILGGFLWPLEAQPDILRYYISPWLPQTYPSIALRDIIYKGHGLVFAPVWSSFLILFAWLGVVTVIAIAILRLRS